MKKMIKETVAWIKDIPHKLHILLDNLFTLAEAVSMLSVGIYTIVKIVPTFHGYIATGALVAAAILTVSGTFRLTKFLLGGAK